MSKKIKSYPLSGMVAGVNRYAQQTGKHQAVEALDVVQDDGDLRRRDAFASFAAAAPHMLPAAKTYMKSLATPSGTFTSYSTRTFSATDIDDFENGSKAATKRLFIGCDVPFYGLDIRRLSVTQTDYAARSVYVRVRFIVNNWTSTGNILGDYSTNLYQELPFYLDQTIGTDINTGAVSATSMSRSGRIQWHSGQVPSTWAAFTVDSQSAYWVILDFSTTKRNPDASSQSSIDYITSDANAQQFKIVLEPPGIRCFTLEPVTGLYTVGSQLLVASTRDGRRGQETGGPQLGVIQAARTETEYVGLAKDWGAGMVGTIGTSVWGSEPGPAADELQKNDRTYKWRRSAGTGVDRIHNGSWGYPLLHGEAAGGTNAISPLGSPTPTTTTFSITLTNSYDTEFEDCIALCTVQGTGGPTAGRYNRIKTSTVSGSTVALTFAAAWNGTPATDSEFIIFGVPHRFTSIEMDEPPAAITGSPTYPQQVWIEIPYALDDNDHQVSIRPLGPDAGFIGDCQDIQDLTIDDGHVQFIIARESRYELPHNPYPDYAFDPQTADVIFAFGDYPMQLWDGIKMRPLLALSDSTDPNVELWRQNLARKPPGAQEDSGFVSNYFLKSSPPAGRFVQAFASRLFVSGVSSDPAGIFYSAPGLFNNIWPKGYEARIRDPDNSLVTGMNVLNDELVVFTTSTIFASPPPDELGFMNFTPRSHGIGFINNRSVQRVVMGSAAVLLGANSDGIYMFTGAEPRIVLDEWDRVIEGGVNRAALHKSCAAVSYFENCYYLAVPSQNAQYPDRIIRYNWVENTFYVWRAPAWRRDPDDTSTPIRGITAMAVDRDNNGNETLIFGHVDGMISTLERNLKDDGSTITGTAKTALFSSGGTTARVSGYMVTLGDTGATDTVTIKEYLNQDDGDPNTLYSGVFDAGGPEVGSFTIGTDVLASNKTKTKKVRAKSGTKAETLQLEISGTTRWRLRYWEVLLSATGQRSK